MNLMQRVGALVLATGVTAAGAAAWTPPVKPDVDAILNQARDDAIAGRLDEAAAKHRWYHAHALAFKPSHVGVRVSFAMADWVRLARRHPPAMQDMLDAQAQAVQVLKAGGPGAGEALGDLAAFAGSLGDPRPMADAMAWLDANRPADARRHAHEALPALVTANEAALAVRYLDADRWLAERKRSFDAVTERDWLGVAKAEQRERAQAFADREAAFAVAALVKAGRPAEAAAMVERLRAILGSDAKMHFSADALRGHAPPLRRY